MILKLIRNALGQIIIFIDWLTRPKAMQRTPEQQAQVQSALEGHSLYQFRACPFCVKTRRAIRALGVNIELKDINKEPQNRIDLEHGGGRMMVPCLRIEQAGNVRWMYESKDIVEYLQAKVA